MRYLASTLNKKLRLSAKGEMELKCYVDSDWAGDRTDRKSTSGYVFLIGEGVIAWSSRKQTVVATSSTEAEYIAASFAAKELLWLKKLCFDLHLSTEEPTRVFEDNQGCIKLIESESCGARTKHIDICYHQIRDLKEKNVIKIQYCPSNQMLADLFTKPLGREKFQYFTKCIGMDYFEHATARRGVGNDAKHLS